MIDLWSLPGPTEFVRRVVADLRDGRQCVLHGTPPRGLRRALEDVLTAEQELLRIVYDDPELDPEAMLRRESVGDSTRGSVWWVEDLHTRQQPAWMALLEREAERQRQAGIAPLRRRRLVLLLDEAPTHSSALDVSVARAEPLTKTDLEVAARYAAIFAREEGITGRLRIELAVAIASARLPSVEAIDLINHWMAAPNAALFDLKEFIQYAGYTASDGLLVLLWQAQYAVLLPEVERQRICLIYAHKDRWRLPYSVDPSDGRPRRVIEQVERLELRHLCAQLRELGEPRSSPLRKRLEALRDLRNTLSHLDELTLTEVSALNEPLP